MRVAEGVDPGGGGAVGTREHGGESVPGLPVGADHGIPALFHPQGVDGPLQGVVDFHNPQGIRVQAVPDTHQVFRIQKQLIGVLVPDAAEAPAHHRAGVVIILPGQEFRLVHHGTGEHLSGAVAGVPFKGDFIGFPDFGGFGENQIAAVVVGVGHPIGPVGAEGHPVHIDKALAA